MTPGEPLPGGPHGGVPMMVAGGLFVPTSGPHGGVPMTPGGPHGGVPTPGELIDHLQQQLQQQQQPSPMTIFASLSVAEQEEVIARLLRPEPARGGV